jgi:hypothetical protein
MYMPMNIHIHYLLFVTLCGQFCSWVNKSYYYYYYYYYQSFPQKNPAMTQKRKTHLVWNFFTLLTGPSRAETLLEIRPN